MWLQAVKVYSKALPTTTYEELEQGFRVNNMNTYLIASVSGLYWITAGSADSHFYRRKRSCRAPSL